MDNQNTDKITQFKTEVEMYLMKRGYDLSFDEAMDHLRRFKDNPVNHMENEIDSLMYSDDPDVQGFIDSEFYL